ncbi:MAG: AAA family ATPase [Leptolyngbyaceae cyanobacterium bins.59]|nr:AAA family ATPase [Leptolyngbyaceae cyanobacterium bins.59]
MQKDRVEPFADNWSYLKAELNWLDRVLMAAVARQRKETKEVERVAQNRADRITSHWWKGIILLDGECGYDESPARPTPPEANAVRPGYQQQLQQRIQASQQQGIGLGLPMLCDRLRLSLFEKNLVLLSLAPEVNRRYGRIYRYLQSDPSVDGRTDTRQGGEGAASRLETELPTVDLALRILCRNDTEWRTARKRLICPSPLIQHHLLKVLSIQEPTLLTRRLQLSDGLTNYLLADQPGREMLEALLLSLPGAKVFSPPPPVRVNDRLPKAHWSDLVLPPDLLDTLHHWCDRVRLGQQIETDWHLSAQLGTLALLVGSRGTGKTLAAEVIAQELQTSLMWVDLQQIPEADSPSLLKELIDQAPQVLLLRSAHLWFGRSTLLPAATLHQFLEKRRQTRSLTLLSVREQTDIKYLWRQSLDGSIAFPMPDVAARMQLWKRAVASLPVEPRLAWKTLAQQWSLSGGEIEAIVRDAAVYAATSPDAKLKLGHIHQALQQRQKILPQKFLGGNLKKPPKR